MKLRSILERWTFAVVVILSLVALWLVVNAPSTFLNARVVYQGF
jgi:hypothetical protein